MMEPYKNCLYIFQNYSCPSVPMCNAKIVAHKSISFRPQNIHATKSKASIIARFSFFTVFIILCYFLPNNTIQSTPNALRHNNSKPRLYSYSIMLFSHFMMQLFLAFSFGHSFTLSFNYWFIRVLSSPFHLPPQCRIISEALP